MGSRLFDFLSESFLFSDRLIEERFASVPISDIERELRQYREHWLNHEHAVMGEIKPGPSELAIYYPEPISVSDLTRGSWPYPILGS